MSGAQTIHAGASLGLPAPWTDQTGTALRRPDGGLAVLTPLVVSRDSSGRPTMQVNNNGTVASFSYSPASMSPVTTPAMYRTSMGEIGRIAESYFQAALGYSGKIIAVDTSGQFYKYTDAAGWVARGPSLAGATQMLFVDSRGYLFYSAGRGVYRSTDDGGTWSLVTTLVGTTDLAKSVTEDDLGNLYIAAYGTSSAGATGYNSGLGLNSRTLMKSADAGATWTDISSAFPVGGDGVHSGAAGVHRHLHCVHWDKYRSVLIVTMGDDGVTSKPYVSNDHGATFTQWENSANQVTAVVATPSAVFMAGDGGGSRGVYKAESTSYASLLASTPVVSLDWTSLGYANNSSTYIGFALHGLEDTQGNVSFFYGSEGAQANIVATQDGGATWGELYKSAAGAVRAFHECVYPSVYQSGWDGFLYGYDSSIATARGGSISKYRALSRAVALPVTAAQLMTTQAIQSPGVVQQLTEDITTPMLITGANCHVLADTVTIGAVSGKGLADLAVNETWEGAPSGWSTTIDGVGVITKNSTDFATSGTQSLKADITGGAGSTSAYAQLTTNPMGTPVVGDEIWFRSKVRISAITATALTLLRLYGGGSTTMTSIRVLTYDGVNRIHAMFAVIGIAFGQSQPYESVVIPVAEWFTLKVRFTIGNNANPVGRVTVWIDTGAGYRMAMDVAGLPTHNTTLSSDLMFGANSSGNFTTVYYDETRISKNFDPDLPPACTLSNPGASVIGKLYA